MFIHRILLKETYLANLKSNVNKLDNDQLKNVPSGLSNLKSKVDKLDNHKLVLFLVDLNKLIDVVKIDVVKIDIYKANIKNIEDKYLILLISPQLLLLTLK